MPRIKTDAAQEGMIVAADVKNIDGMLLIPAGTKLSVRQVNILQAWGVAELEIQAGGASGVADPLTQLSPQVLETLTAELRAEFWEPNDSSPVGKEIFRVILSRRAVLSLASSNPP
jgi:hypothetical protein